jgi:protocatechuate 3,4-dioxygenase beta subunit
MSWPLLLFALQWILLQTANPAGSIRGVVMKARTVVQQPLQNARVELTDGPGTPLIARTDAGGRFIFSGLAPGRYRLSVTRDGFVRQQFPNAIVIRPELNIRDIVFQLEPAATLAGWVQDEFGQPLGNALVEALRSSYDVRGHRTLVRAASAITDDRGEYRVFWLDPGEYVVYVTSQENAAQAHSPAVAPTYFPGVADPADAKPIRLDLGREAGGVDLRVRGAALQSVDGYISNALTGRPAAAVVTLTRPADVDGISRYQAMSAASGPQAGRFAIPDPLPPGSYIVRAKSVSNEDLQAVDRIVLRPVPVPGPPYHLRLTLSAPLGITGRMIVESGAAPDLRQTKVSLASVDAEMPSPPPSTPEADGQFQLNGVRPGSYVMDLAGLPEDVYVKAARYGGKDILEEPLTIASGEAPSSLQILLSTDGGWLRAAVFDRNDRSSAGAQVVLVPEMVRRHRREEYRISTSDDTGAVDLRGIRPGRYKLFAWETLEPNAYLNGDFVRRYEDLGTPVEIAAGANAPVAVRLIPNEF